MRTSVLHQSRVAWDLALATVAIAQASTEHIRWFSAQLDQRFGPAMRDAFRDSRYQLLHSERPDVHAVELGRWRVRIEDLLGEDPSLAEDLTLLRLEANSRVAGL